MEEWVKLCDVKQAPANGEVAEAEVEGVAICLANVDGTLRALDNWCPHRRGPLGQGWLEGNAVVCPWHSWEFDCVTGQVAEPDGPAKVEVFQVKVEGDAVMIHLPK